MMIRFRSGTPRDKDTLVTVDTVQQPPNQEPKTMRWETPRATDFRFGMEITMYIAHR